MIRGMSDFAKDAEKVTRWIDGYFENVRRYPVLSQVAPGDLIAALPSVAPEGPETFDAIMADFERLILPGITHWNHPRFFA